MEGRLHNCVEYKFAYADNGEPAGSVVVYKPNLQYLGDPLEKLVGDSGRGLLKEMCHIRFGNLKFAGEEPDLSLIEEFKYKNYPAHDQRKKQKSDERFLLKTLQDIASPKTGGFRRLVLMTPRVINGKEFRQVYWFSIYRSP